MTEKTDIQGNRTEPQIKPHIYSQMTLTSVTTQLIGLGQYFQQTVLRTLDIQMQRMEHRIVLTKKTNSRWIKNICAGHISDEVNQNTN